MFFVFLDGLVFFSGFFWSLGRLRGVLDFCWLNHFDVGKSLGVSFLNIRRLSDRQYLCCVVMMLG